MSKRTIRRRLSTIALGAAVALFASLTLSTSPASASAFGSTFFGPKICTPKIHVCQGAGTLNVNTTGHGVIVTQMAGSFVYKGTISDFWLDNDIFDPQGNRIEAAHCQGPYHGGYATVYGRTCTFRAGSFQAPAGSHHCATLWRGSSSGPKQAARACNRIS